MCSPAVRLKSCAGIQVHSGACAQMTLLLLFLLSLLTLTTGLHPTTASGTTGLLISNWTVRSEHLSDTQLTTLLPLLHRSKRSQVRESRLIAVAEGRVPGYVLSDLHREGFIADPLAKDHDVKFRPFSLLTWVYSCEVELSSGGGANQTREDAPEGLLVFEGIDTVAVVILNKAHLFAGPSNQFRRLVIPLSREILRADSLLVEVVIESAVVETAKQAAAYPHLVPPTSYPAVQHGEPFRNFIRKSPSSFSWDWGPAFIPSGIWRPVLLVRGERFHVIATSLTVTGPGEGGWRLKGTVEVKVLGQLYGDLSVSLALQSLSDGSAPKFHSGDTTERGSETRLLEISVIVQNPKLWWPRSLGKAELYRVTILVCDELSCQTITKTTGFRNVTLDQTPLRRGKKFQFLINGHPIFVRGANMVPLSVFNGQGNPSLLFERVEAAGIDTIRVWGGGVYQDGCFYEEADRRGVMVWQELMFACSLYPADQRFLENVAVEVSEQVGRLSHHPSIILVSGNNENKQGLQEDWYNTTAHKELYVEEYQRLYEGTILPALSPLLSVPFLLSSPSNGESAGPWVEDVPNSELAGDMHYYNYTRRCLDTSTLPIPRFASEFGWQSFPALSTLTSALHTRDITFSSTEHRQHLVNGTSLLHSQLSGMFDAPLLSLANRSLTYLTQLHHSLCLSAEIGHFRRNSHNLHPDGRGLTAGVMFWQLNDVWAAPAWSVLDVEMRPKMAWYGVREAYREALVEGIWNGSHVTFHLITSHVTDYSLDVFLYDVRSTASLAEWGFSGQDTGPGVVGTLNGEELNRHCPDFQQCFVAAELTGGSGSERSTHITRLGYDWKGVELSNPHLSVTVIRRTEVGELWVRVRAEAVAVWVWLESREETGVFSRNNFVMYVPEVIVIFRPDEKKDDCCHIHGTSLYNHVTSSGEF